MTYVKTPYHALWFVAMVTATLGAFPCRAQGNIPLQPMTPQSAQYFNPKNSVNLAFSQAFSSNWAMGEDNYFAVRFASRLNDQRAFGPINLRSTLQFALGANYANDSIPENALRVGDNDFFNEEVGIYPIKWALDPYVAFNIRTPITESFTYYGGRRNRTQSFWDPVVTQQSAGFNHMLNGKSGMLNTRIGLALRQTRTHLNTSLTDDYTTRGIAETYRAQSGIEFASDANFRADSTVSYSGRFSMFGSFDDLGVWSLRWDNETRFVLWKSIGLTWTLQVLHDVRQTRRTQFKQAILLGLIQDF